MGRILLLTLFCGCFSLASAQELDVIFQEEDRVIIRRIDIANNCNATDIATVNGDYNDITFDSRGNVFLVNNFDLFRLESNSATLVDTIYFNDDFGITGLSAVQDTLILSATDANPPNTSGEIILYVQSTGEIIRLAGPAAGTDIPGSAGDISPFSGGYYMSTDQGTLVQINKDGTLNESATITYPATDYEVLGITLSYANCANPSAFNVAYKESVDSSLILGLDLVTREFTEVCAFSGQINGAATLREFVGGNCLLELDLDGNDNTASGSDYADTTCLGEMVRITDNDLSITSDTTLELIRFFPGNDIEVDATGLPVNFVYDADNFTISVNENADPQTVSSFMQALLALQISSVVAGDKEIEVQVANVLGDVAEATMFLRVLELTGENSDTTIQLCRSDAPLMLNTLLSEDEVAAGFWRPSQYNSSALNPLDIQDSLVAVFTIESEACGDIERRFVFQIAQELPTDFLPQDTFLCIADSFMIQPILDDGVTYSYRWQDSSTAPFYLVQEAGRYSLELSSGGCTSRDSMVVVQENCLSCNLEFPNIFSPFGVRTNIFAASTDCQFLEFQAEVYDRWGNMVARSDDPDFIWDGTYADSDELLPASTYIYKVVFKLGEQNEEVIRSGDITLVY